MSVQQLCIREERSLFLAGGYIFNTEAHPLDPAIVYCCSAKRNNDLEMIARFENNIDFASLAGIFDETLHPFGRRSDIVSDAFSLVVN